MYSMYYAQSAGLLTPLRSRCRSSPMPLRQNGDNVAVRQFDVLVHGSLFVVIWHFNPSQIPDDRDIKWVQSLDDSAVDVVIRVAAGGS